MTISIKNLRQDQPCLPCDFRVDRASPVGNPFTHIGYLGDAKRDAVCDNYDFMFDAYMQDKKFAAYINSIVAALRKYGFVNLFCWCWPKRCHAETIARFVWQQYKKNNYRGS